MEKINWGRLILGGIVTGISLIASAAVAAAIFSQQLFRSAMQTLRASGSFAAVFFLVVFLLLGALLTSTYAAIRPRFGAGPKTAALAGFGVWLTGVSLAIVGFVLQSVAMGQPYPLPEGPLVPCLCLAMMVTSSIVGASVYAEQQN